MKKNIRIALLITVFLFIIWLLAIIIYAMSHPELKGYDPLPIYLSAPIFTIFICWFLFGIIYAMCNIRAVRNLLNEFINE
jgi:uncharacterized membrane protein YhdT